MTTLCLDRALENSSRSVDLHEWLGGAWGLLFSNPSDFIPQGPIEQYWLDGLRREFAMRQVRALAVKRDGVPGSSWIDAMHPDRTVLDRPTVRLREPSFAAADPVSCAARGLRGDLLALRSRYVLIIDGALKRHQVVKYSADEPSVSVLRLLLSIDALRGYGDLVTQAA